MELHLARLIAFLVPLAAGVIALYRVLFAPVPRPAIDFFALRGAIDHQRSQGAWRPVRDPRDVHPGDSLRTGKDASVRFGISSREQIELAPDSELVLTEANRTLQEVTLRRGELVATLALDPARLVRVTEEIAHVLVEGIGGRFSISSDGRGRVTVRNEGGEVRYVHQGQKRRLRPKEVVRVGRRPLFASALPVVASRFGVPAALLLKAEWPKHLGATVVSLRGVNVEARSARREAPAEIKPVRRGKQRFRFKTMAK